MHGLEPIATQRVLRCSYGVDLCVDFDPAIHSISSTYAIRSPWDNKMLWSDYINWFASMVSFEQRLTVQ